MALNIDELGDLVELTYNRSLAKNKWVDISLGLQRYFTSDRFLKGKKMPMKGGPLLTWKAQVGNIQSARWSGLYGQDSYDARNIMVGASQPWSKATCNYTYDIDEPEFQGDDYTLIVEEILVREHSMYNGWFELLEEGFWTGPSSSTLDPRPINGVPHWIQKNATEGFNGGDPSGFAAGAGGILGATYSKWKNYSGGEYTAITRDDLVTRILKALEFCHFQAPHEFKRLDAGEPDFTLNTTWEVLEGMQKFLDSRNDNLTDVAGMAGRVTFKGLPVIRVPALDTADFAAYDSSNPLYGINWTGMKFFFKKGADMRRNKPVPKDGQHDVRVVHVDSWCGLLCENRREQFVVSQAS